MDTGVIEGGLNVTLTIRLLMHGKVRVPSLPRAAPVPGNLLELLWAQERAAATRAGPGLQPAKKIIMGCGGDDLMGARWEQDEQDWNTARLSEGQILSAWKLVLAVKRAEFGLGTPGVFKTLTNGAFVSLPGGGQHHWEGE